MNNYTFIFSEHAIERLNEYFPNSNKEEQIKNITNCNKDEISHLKTTKSYKNLKKSKAKDFCFFKNNENTFFITNLKKQYDGSYLNVIVTLINSKKDNSSFITNDFVGEMKKGASKVYDICQLSNKERFGSDNNQIKDDIEENNSILSKKIKIIKESPYFKYLENFHSDKYIKNEDIEEYEIIITNICQLMSFINQNTSYQLNYKNSKNKTKKEIELIKEQIIKNKSKLSLSLTTIIQYKNNLKYNLNIGINNLIIKTDILLTQIYSLNIKEKKYSKKLINIVDNINSTSYFEDLISYDDINPNKEKKYLSFLKNLNDTINIKLKIDKYYTNIKKIKNKNKDNLSKEEIEQDFNILSFSLDKINTNYNKLCSNLYDYDKEELEDINYINKSFTSLIEDIIETKSKVLKSDYIYSKNINNKINNINSDFNLLVLAEKFNISSSDFKYINNYIFKYETDLINNKSNNFKLKKNNVLNSINNLKFNKKYIDKEYLKKLDNILNFYEIVINEMESKNIELINI